jgi:hypothetical protein
VVETQFNHPLIIFLVGCIIVLAILVRSYFIRGGLPPLVGIGLESNIVKLLGQWRRVMVSADTCMFPPLMVRPLLRRWPQPKGEGP